MEGEPQAERSTAPITEYPDQHSGRQSEDVDGGCDMGLAEVEPDFEQLPDVPTELQQLIRSKVDAVTYGSPDPKIRRIAYGFVTDEVLSRAAFWQSKPELIVARDNLLSRHRRP